MRYDGSYHELGEISQITELSEFSKITSFYFKARQRINSPVYQCLLADTNVSSYTGEFRLYSVSLKFFLSVNHIIQCSSKVDEPILIKVSHNDQ